MPEERLNLYLVGYRCTGKSTVGRKLARQLDFAFYDTDEQIVAGEQKEIARIVADRGWPYFRELEEKCLRRLSGKSRSVIATGGGIVLNPGNIACMQNSGMIIWLQASPATILDRLRQDPQTAALRPALTRQALAEEVRATLAERTALYRRAADLSLGTDTAGPDEIVAQIRNRILWPDTRKV